MGIGVEVSILLSDSKGKEKMPGKCRSRGTPQGSAVVVGRQGSDERSGAQPGRSSTRFLSTSPALPQKRTPGRGQVAIYGSST